MFTLDDVKEIVDLLDNDGHVFSKRLCVTCKTVSELVGQPFGCVKKAMNQKPEFRAEFLWPYDDDSIENAGFEFANGKTEEYCKQWWDILVAKIKEEEAAKHR